MFLCRKRIPHIAVTVIRQNAEISKLYPLINWFFKLYVPDPSATIELWINREIQITLRDQI